MRSFTSLVSVALLVIASTRQSSAALDFERCGDWGQPFGSSKSNDEICNYCYDGTYAWGQEPQDHMLKTTFRQSLANYIGHRNPGKITKKMGADLTKAMYDALTDDQRKALDIFYLQDCRTGKSYYYGSHAANSHTIKCRYCNPTWQDCDTLVPKDASSMCGKDGLKCESCNQYFNRDCRSHTEELQACPGCEADINEETGLRRCPPERDMNFATAEQLTKINNINEDLAKMIVKSRPVDGINDLAKKILEKSNNNEAAAKNVLAAGKLVHTLKNGEGQEIERNQGLCYCRGGTFKKCPVERDVNLASEAQLAAIDGIGSDRAALIIQNRGEVGYATVSEAWFRMSKMSLSKSLLTRGWRDQLCTDGTRPGCPYALLKGKCCDASKAVHGRCTDGITKTTTQDTETTVESTTTTTMPTTTTKKNTTVSTTTTTTTKGSTTTRVPPTTTTTMKKTCRVESTDQAWSGSWFESGDDVVITMTAKKPAVTRGFVHKFWVAIGFSANNEPSFPESMQVYMGEIFSEQQVTAKYYDKAVSKYVSKSKDTLTDSLLSSSCTETSTEITCTFKRKAKMEGLVTIDTENAQLGIYWAYGKVLKGGPHFETEKGKAKIAGCNLHPVPAPQQRGPENPGEKPPSGRAKDPDTVAKCWEADYQIVRGDGGNDGINDVDSVDGTMSAGGPTCGDVEWVALVVSPLKTNGPTSGDVFLGALTWQKYKVYDEYAESATKFTRDIRMEPKAGTRDMLDSKCDRQTQGGLTCSFSKKLLSGDIYDVNSKDNDVYLIYGDYDANRARRITKTVHLGQFMVKKSKIVIVRDPADYPEEPESNSAFTPTSTTGEVNIKPVDLACRRCGVTVITVMMLAFLMI